MYKGKREGDMPWTCNRVVAALGCALLSAAGAAAAPAHTRSAAAATAHTTAAAPAGLDVSLSVEDNEWSLGLWPANPGAVAEVRYRLTDAGDAIWHKADECSCVALGALTPGRHRVEIEVIGKAGSSAKTAYTFSFDPDEEIVRLAKDYLAMSYHWIGFDDRPRYSWSLGFVGPVTYRDALKEVRWSLDDCTLDRRFPLGPPSPPGNYALPRAVGHDQKLDERVPVSAEFVCVQLVFRDGSTSEQRRIYREQPFPPPPEPTATTPAPAATTPSMPPTPPTATTMATVAPSPAAAQTARAAPGAPSPEAVRLDPQRSNAGWMLGFATPRRRDLREIHYRLDGATEWQTTGTSAEINLDRQERLPRTSVTVDPRWVTPGRHRVEVELIDSRGGKSGPYMLWFDPEAEVLAAAKRLAVNPKVRWVSLRDYSGRRLAYFDLAFKDALREIRYSLDGCALDRRFPFDRWTDLSQPPRYTEKSDMVLPEGTSSVCVQLVFRDGEVSAPRRFGMNGEEAR
jgi:hypothetical protein